MGLEPTTLHLFLGLQAAAQIAVLRRLRKIASLTIFRVSCDFWQFIVTLMIILAAAWWAGVFLVAQWLSIKMESGESRVRVSHLEDKISFLLSCRWFLPKWFLFYYYIFKQYGFVFIYHPGQTKFGDVTFNIFHYDITVYAFAVFRFNFERWYILNV